MIRLKFKIVLLLITLLIGMFVLTGASYAASYTYTTIDDPWGVSGTYAMSINDNGDVVGYYNDGNGYAHGFLYKGGSYTTLDDPLAVVRGTYAMGINDSGEVVGYYYDGNGYAHGFLYKGGSYTALDDPLEVGQSQGGGGTWAYGINNNEEVVGEYWGADGTGYGVITAGFLYMDGAYTTLVTPPSNYILWDVNGINDSGEVVGLYGYCPDGPCDSYDPAYGVGFPL